MTLTENAEIELAKIGISNSSSNEVDRKMYKSILRIVIDFEQEPQNEVIGDMTISILTKLLRGQQLT